MSRSRQSAAAGRPAPDRIPEERGARSAATAPLVPSGDESSPVSAIAADFAAGHTIARHRHRRAQLVYAVEGVMTVVTDAGLWVVPPLRAVWLPAGVVHSIRMTGNVRMRTVYFDEEALAGAATPGRPAVLAVSPLMRELVVRAADSLHLRNEGATPASARRIAKVVDLLLEELREAPVGPLEIPVPADARLRRVTQALMKDPSDSRDLAAWARVAGMSERTLARAFPEQTGMTLMRWRQQVRLLRALERLATGETVTTVTMDLGYGSVSAFVKLFRESFGVTPGRYFDH